MKEFEGGRRPTKENCGTVKEKQRCTDDQTKYPRVGANDDNWSANHAILWKNSSILSFEESTTTRTKVLTKEREKLRGGSPHIKEIRQDETVVEQGIKIS